MIFNNNYVVKIIIIIYFLQDIGVNITRAVAPMDIIFCYVLKQINSIGHFHKWQHILLSLCIYIN